MIPPRAHQSGTKANLLDLSNALVAILIRLKDTGSLGQTSTNFPLASATDFATIELNRSVYYGGLPFTSGSLVQRCSTMLFLPCEEGQGLVEYALILVLIAIVSIVVLGLLGGQVSGVFSYIEAVCA
jgi:pilus assembly protein Flp/PilA